MIPWSAFWDRNYFSLALPPLGMVLRNNFVRGAISGLGLVDCGVAFAELGRLVAGRRHDPDQHRRSTAADGRMA